MALEMGARPAAARTKEQVWPHGCWPVTFLTLASRWQSVKTTCAHPCCFRCSKTAWRGWAEAMLAPACGNLQAPSLAASP